MTENLREIFDAHRGGKIEVTPKLDVESREQLSVVYTPGVARVCEAIAGDLDRARDLTIKGNTVAVFTDGSAILGLGDLGPEAALPVMEGKAMLFKSLAKVNAFPICVRSQSVDEIVTVAKAIAPSFGGFNLEDISAPRCFEIERRLHEEVAIPVFHDDQHGTAVVFLAALYNALKITGKRPENLKVVISGAGAAGIACTKILLSAGISNIIVCDRNGAIYQGRQRGMNPSKDELANISNPNHEHGSLREALGGADVFLGVSGPNLLMADDLGVMAEEPVVFALSNPVPEVDPVAGRERCAVMATGRSDFPNQINNVLCFPGFFRGLLDARARFVTETTKLAAAKAISELVSDSELSRDYILPAALDKRVPAAVAEEVRKAAKDEGAHAC